MPRDRKGAQLSLELEPQLLERLRARAAADGRPLAVMVRRWLEAGLDGALEQQAGLSGPDLADLAERVGRLEAGLAQIRRSPERVEPLPAPLPPAPAAASPEQESPAPLPQRRLTPAEAEGLLTTPQVRAALGLASDSALTNWIARANKRGGSAVGGIYGGHRLRGKGLLPGGQKPGWLWERLPSGA